MKRLLWMTDVNFFGPGLKKMNFVNAVNAWKAGKNGYFYEFYQIKTLKINSLYCLLIKFKLLIFETVKRYLNFQDYEENSYVKLYHFLETDMELHGRFREIKV